LIQVFIVILGRGNDLTILRKMSIFMKRVTFE